MEATFCTPMVTTAWHISGYYYEHTRPKSKSMEATFCTLMVTTGCRTKISSVEDLMIALASCRTKISFAEESRYLTY